MLSSLLIPVPGGGLLDSLHTGVALCDLLNEVRPGTVGRVRRDTGEGREGATSSARSFHFIANVGAFLQGCQQLGMAQVHLFEVNDLINQKNPVQVLHTLTKLREVHEELRGIRKVTPRKMSLRPNLFDATTPGSPRTPDGTPVSARGTM